MQSWHNSAKATRFQTPFARLLSQARMLKINRDHHARLVSWNRDWFAYYTYVNISHILYTYTQETVMPTRVLAFGPIPCGGKHIYFLRELSFSQKLR